MRTYSVLIFAIIGLASAFPQDDSRIVNGIKAASTPYFGGVLVRKADSFTIWCGCSLVDSQHVVSAAHCFPKNADPANYKISLGSMEWQQGTWYPVDQIFIHEKYQSVGQGDDIAVLRLAIKVDYTPTLRPIALPRLNEPLPVGSHALVTGYGYTKNKGYDMQEHARQTNVPVLDDNDSGCPYGLTGSNFCAGNSGEPTADSCQGDSGGPLVTNSRLIGVVSYGGECNSAYAAGVYTTVAKYVDWISEKTDF